MTPDITRSRRDRIRAASPDTAFVFAAAETSIRNRTVAHPYRQDSDLLFLTGIEEPEVVLVLLPEGEDKQSVLYVRPRDPLYERWQGGMLGLEGAASASGVDEVRPIDQFNGDLVGLLTRCDQVAWRLGRSSRRDGVLLDALGSAWGKRRRRDDRLPDIVDPTPMIAALRLRKDADEIDRIRRASRITAEAFESLRLSLKAGDTELALAGRLEAAFRAGGSPRTAFETIVASGPRATCLHASPTDRQIQEGELVLVDAGAEWGGYASDCSRTWAVGGQLDTAQAAVHDLVSEAHRAAIDAVAPGVTLQHIHQTACDTLAANLGDLGLPGAVERWFVHQTSHWIGLDVHDVGGVQHQGEPLPLEPGMVFSIEPGLYIDPSDEDAPAELRGIGVRIEDTILVTPSGCEALTRPVS